VSHTIVATRELLAPVDDVWALVAEPYHLPDWWPCYEGVHPDKRGLAEGARWQVRRTASPGLLRRPRGEGLIVIQSVVKGRELAWRDVQQSLGAGVRLASAGPEQTKAVAFVEGASWRIAVEGARGLPRLALYRLHALCQTAASL
jgi:uncharacterized protein YndB with AHSA1/START domain